LYGLYKQIKCGPAPPTATSATTITTATTTTITKEERVAAAKLDAWRSCEQMSIMEAKMIFLILVFKINMNWNYQQYIQ